MADRPTGAAVLEAHGVLTFARNGEAVYVLAGEIAGVKAGAVASMGRPPEVEIVLRGGGSMMVSGNVDAVRDVWVAALSRMVAAEGQRAINVATLGGRS